MDDKLVVKAINSFIKNNGVLGNVVDAFIKGYVSAIIENQKEAEPKKEKKE